MSISQFLFLLPYFLALCFSLSILIFTWIRWRVNAAGEFGWFLFGQNLWLLSLIMRLISESLAAKLFWDKMEWLAAIIASVALPVFVLKYIDVKIDRGKRYIGFFAIFSLAFVVFLFTDPIHHLAYKDISLVPGPVFTELRVVYTWPANMMVAVCLLGALTSMIFLFIHNRKASKLVKRQALLVIVGVLLPVIGVVFSYFNIHIIAGRDAGPLAAVIGDLFIAWGLFKFSLFNIVPIAREQILENMDDMVIVLDAADRVVVINKKTLSELQMESRQVLGHSVFEVLAKYPFLFEKFKEYQNSTTEVFFKGDWGYHHFDIKCTIMNDRFGNYQGRIFVARDVTSYAELQWRLKELNENLERRVAEQTRQLAESYDTTLEGWAKALELRDKETEGHSRRVTEKTIELARQYGIADDQIDHIRRGAILHDIGKMAIPDDILRTKKNLTPEDWEIIRRHPVTAYELLKKIPFLQPAMDIPYCHHEHWDGSGYPRGLKGEEIPIAARLFSVVDVWDALLSNRTYSKAWTREEVISYITEKSGTEFDPHVVEAFLKMER